MATAHGHEVKRKPLWSVKEELAVRLCVRVCARARVCVHECMGERERARVRAHTMRCVIGQVFCLDADRIKLDGLLEEKGEELNRHTRA